MKWTLLHRVALCGTGLLLLTGCLSSPTDDAKVRPTPTRSTPMADQNQVLTELAAELRETVDALAALVPAVTFGGSTGDSAGPCFIYDEDDGTTQQWGYSFRFFFDGDPEMLGAAARQLLIDRGFMIRETQIRADPVSYTALRDGASITVNADPLDPSTGKTGSAVVFVGNSACVAPDGTVDTTNPS